MVITHQSKTVQVSLIFQLWNSTNGGQTACMAIKITLTALDPPVCHWPRSGQLTVLIWSAIKKKWHTYWRLRVNYQKTYLKALSEADFFSCKHMPQKASDCLFRSRLCMSSFCLELPNPLILRGNVAE